MITPRNRREFLRTAMNGAGLAVMGTALEGLLNVALAQPRGGSVAFAALRDDLVQITGAGGNVVAYPAADGIAMVDSGSFEQSQALIAAIEQQLGRAPVSLLLNTHWHSNHTGANESIGESGATIIAHENTRLWMSTEFYVDWQDRTYPPRPAAALPTETFYSSDPQPIALSFGDEQIEYGHLREAHTDGDIYVFFRERNVLVAGGAVSVGAYPILDYATGGWIGGLMDATKKLVDIADASTLIVPESGPAQSRAYLEAQYEMLATVRGRVEDMMRQGKSAAEMIAEGVTAEFDAAWGNNRELFVANIYQGSWWGNRLTNSL